MLVGTFPCEEQQFRSPERYLYSLSYITVILFSDAETRDAARAGGVWEVNSLFNTNRPRGCVNRRGKGSRWEQVHKIEIFFWLRF
jgi:hypothetical protein